MHDLSAFAGSDRVTAAQDEMHRALHMLEQKGRIENLHVRAEQPFAEGGQMREAQVLVCPQLARIR
jgi:hypothetical protein